MSGIEPLDRLREMFGLDGMSAADVFDAIERYDAKQQATIQRLTEKIQAERAERQVIALQAAHWCQRLGAMVAPLDDETRAVLRDVAEFAALCEVAAR